MIFAVFGVSLSLLHVAVLYIYYY